MALFKINRGNESNLPVELKDGWAYFCTDNGNFHIDYINSDGELQRRQINSEYAAKLRYLSDGEYVELTAEQLAEAIKNFQAGQVQADWNQTDDTAADYIKNRPFYSIPAYINLIPAEDLPFVFDREWGGHTTTGSVTLEQLTTWKGEWSCADIMWDGTKYSCEPQYLQGMKIVGNIDALIGAGNNGIPFIIAIVSEAEMGSDMYMMMSLTDSYSEILSNTYLSSTLVEGQSYYAAEVGALSLVDGTEYHVYYNYLTNKSVAVSYVTDDATYIGLGDPSIMGLGDSTGDNYFIYTKTASDGTVSSAVVASSEWFCDVSIAYAPDTTHNVSVSLNTENIKCLDSKFIPNVPWNKISDKPFGDAYAGTVVVDETTVDCQMQFNDGIYANIISTIGLINGSKYSVEFDGGTYELTATNGDGMIMVSYEGEDIAFLLADNFNGSGESIAMSTQGTHTYKITLAEDAIIKIDSKYLPDDIGSNALPEVTTSDNNKVMTVVDGVWTAQIPASGLPDVTTSDNDKVLKVSNGAWTVSKCLPSVTESDDGKVLAVSGGAWTVASSLPAVTADDAGKFLRVSAEGLWTVEALQNAEEVSF